MRRPEPERAACQPWQRIAMALPIALPIALALALALAITLAITLTLAVSGVKPRRCSGRGFPAQAPGGAIGFARCASRGFPA